MNPARTATDRVRVRRHAGTEDIGGRATLAVEEPLEIRVDGDVVATTMRTPGNDFDLALGFAVTDAGVDPADVATIRYCGPGAGETPASGATADLTGPYRGRFNVIDVATRGRNGAPVHRHRVGVVTSACGICGADLIADLETRTGSVGADRVVFDPAAIAAMPRLARAAQAGFAATGATHAAAAFTADTALRVLREDVGRHNAVDKVIGALATDDGLPAQGLALFVSGRVAYEIVAKALIAGFPAVVAVSAPTSLAVTTADQAGLTLVGFARDGDFTVYTRPDRLNDQR